MVSQIEVGFIGKDNLMTISLLESVLMSSLQTQLSMDRRFQKCDQDVENLMASDAEDSVFQMLNDDDSVTSVQEEYDPVDDETDEEEEKTNKNNKDASNAYTFSGFWTAMERYE
ncbi:hypothetical protein TNCV_4926381 [Trichonephila clavipes]|nr:hypothetical protein TNCV_4926381 [Trichonephila clavipes]